MANGGAALATVAPARGIIPRGLRWPLIFAIWAIPGLISASQTFLYYADGPDAMPFSSAVAHSLPPWLYWALVTPAILALGRAFRLERDTWPRSVAVHLIANVILSAGHVSANIATGMANGGHFYLSNPLDVVFVKVATKSLVWELFTYWAVLGVAHAVEYRRRFQERAVAAAALEGKLAQAQLEALKMQLHPHFLFNTLHAIAVLVRKGDSQGSVRMISGLSDLLRLALDTVGAQLVPLKQEMDFVGRYLDIEKIRFQDRLRVTHDIAHDTLDAEVPNLVLQPLVENAIRHGISATASASELEIAARRQGDRLVITVRDDGAGPRAAFQPGVGLRNVRARLEQLYPGDHRFELAADERGGARVTLEIPFRHA
jgi:two-component system LytT family sensor kinase